MGIRAVAAGGVLALLLSLQAKPPQPPPQQPTFRTGTELVRVDVTVLGSNGQPVTDLTQADFEIEEDGVPKKIQSFKLVEISGAEATDAAAPDGAVQPFELARDDLRVFLVFWDEYHIPQHVPARRLREDLTRFLREITGPGDLVALMDPWTPMSHLRFTRDHYSLLADVSRLQGREGIYMPARNGAEEEHLREGRMELRRAEVSVSALKSAMMHMATLREGRKTVLYFGREFSPGRDRTDAFSETNEAIETANDSNVALYAINPDGLPLAANRTGFLTDLARNSGGEALMTNDLTVALKRAVRQASAYYLIGYSPDPMRHDGKFHKISVKVKRRGMQVRSRSGYWAPTVGEMTNAAAASTAAVATATPEIQRAFGELNRLDRAEDPLLPLPTIRIPEDAGERLAITEPAVWRVTRPAELREVMGETPPAAFAGRQFTRTDRLIVRFTVSGAEADAATLSVALIGRGGKRLTELPFQRADRGAVLDLPLTSIARGDYLIALEAKSGDARAAAYVPIRIQ